MYSPLHFFLSQTFREGKTSSFYSLVEQYFELRVFLKFKEPRKGQLQAFLDVNAITVTDVLLLMVKYVYYKW